MGDQNNIPLIKQKHRTENTINANKWFEEERKSISSFGHFLRNREIAKPGASSQTRGRMTRTKWRREGKKIQKELTYYQSFSKHSGPQQRKGQCVIFKIDFAPEPEPLSLLNLWSVAVEISRTRVARMVYPHDRLVKSFVFIYFHF